jgi:hypothetical protein
LLFAALLLSACAIVQAPVIPPGASMSDVQARLGKPKDVVTASGGDTVWQYPTGPFGSRTYIVTFGPDQRARGFYQALTADNFAKITMEMNRDDIRTMFGRPAETNTYRNLDEEVWSYRYQGPIGQNRIFNVHFDVKTGLVRYTGDQEDPLYMQPLRGTG